MSSSFKIPDFTEQANGRRAWRENGQALFYRDLPVRCTWQADLKARVFALVDQFGFVHQWATR